MAARSPIPIIRPMRRWLLILILIVLPVQFALASVVHCYRFASTSTLQHMARPATAEKHLEIASSLVTASDQAGTPSIDLTVHCECGDCHLTGVQPAGVAETGGVLQRERPAAEPPDGLALELIPAIDRPRWHRAA